MKRYQDELIEEQKSGSHNCLPISRLYSIYRFTRHSFSVLSGVRSMNEIFPIERAAEAYELMMSGKARFRAVLTTGY